MLSAPDRADGISATGWPVEVMRTDHTKAIADHDAYRRFIKDMLQRKGMVKETMRLRAPDGKTKPFDFRGILRGGFFVISYRELKKTISKSCKPANCRA